MWWGHSIGLHHICCCFTAGRIGAYWARLGHMAMGTVLHTYRDTNWEGHIYNIVLGRTWLHMAAHSLVGDKGRKVSSREKFI